MPQRLRRAHVRYVAAGAGGVVVVDVERPEQPKIDQVVSDAKDANDVKWPPRTPARLPTSPMARKG